MQYIPQATPAPDDMHHGHSHGHDHDSDAVPELEQELTIREQLTRDYSEVMCDVDWALTTERDENGFLRLHYAALDNQVTWARWCGLMEEARPDCPRRLRT